MAGVITVQVLKYFV